MNVYKANPIMYTQCILKSSATARDFFSKDRIGQIEFCCRPPDIAGKILHSNYFQPATLGQNLDKIKIN